jgi:hypothetical protein
MNVEKVEMVYTHVQSEVKSDLEVLSMPPLATVGDICDIDGNCIDPRG